MHFCTVCHAEHRLLPTPSRRQDLLQQHAARTDSLEAVAMIEALRCCQEHIEMTHDLPMHVYTQKPGTGLRYLGNARS
jgi:hypothetical protein